MANEPISIEVCCSNCNFFKPYSVPPDNPAGNCRRYPPQLTFVTVDVNRVIPGEQHQPEVLSSDYCGEFEGTTRIKWK